MLGCVRRAITAWLSLLAFALPGHARAWAPLPWGLATVWWDLPDVPVFRSLSIGVTIEPDLPDDAHFYVAPLGHGTLNGIPFYGGLQVGGVSPKGPSRIALFTRWNERKRDAMEVAAGGVGISSGSEGGYISVRQFVDWHSGHYTIRLAVTRTTTSPPASWVEMTVREDLSGRQWTAGALRFPGERLTFGRSVAAFVELFGSSGIAAEDIPKVTVTFGELHINDVAIIPHHAQVEYEAGAPPYAEAEKGAEGSVVIHVGHPYSRFGLAPSGRHGFHQSFYW